MNNYTAENITTSIIVGLTFISAFAALFFAWYFYLKAKQKERMALIEKASEGIDASKLFATPKKRNYSIWLKLGILIFSISVGLLLGSISNLRTEYIPLFGFMFGGLGMIAGHFAGKKEEEKSN
jgi:hypothetical protein